MIQHREDFRVFHAIVSFHGSVPKSNFGLRSVLAGEIHFRDFVNIDLIHVDQFYLPGAALGSGALVTDFDSKALGIFGGRMAS